MRRAGCRIRKESPRRIAFRITLRQVIAKASPIRRTGQPVWLDVPAFSAFVEDVEDALTDGPQLTYSRRLKLLKRADGFGIRRFDANLVIAMVQHRLASAPSPADANPTPRPWLGAMVMVLTIQSVIVATAWLLLARLL